MKAKTSPFLSAACIFLVVQYIKHDTGTSAFSNRNSVSIKNTRWRTSGPIEHRALALHERAAQNKQAVVFRFLLRFTNEHLLLIYYYSVLDLKQTLRKHVFPSTPEKSVRTAFVQTIGSLFQLGYDRNQQVQLSSSWSFITSNLNIVSD